MFTSKLKFFKQQDKTDCGAACIKIILHYYKINISLPKLRTELNTSSRGVSINTIKAYFESIGFNSKLELISLAEFSSINLPSVLFWDKNHFVVLYKIKKNVFYVIDPATGFKKIPLIEFRKHWIVEEDKGIAVTVEKNSHIDNYVNETQNNSLKPLFRKLLYYKRPLLQVAAILFLSSIVQLIIPFLTQSIVDRGINNNDYGFIQLVVIAQFFLFISSTIMDFFQAWVMLHVGIRINLNLATDYAKSLINKDIGFFSSKKEGDLLERLIDNSRIESFLTQSTLSLVVAVLNLLVFGTVLLIYSRAIFLVFLIASIMLVFWITFFLKRRRQVDDERFKFSARTRNELLEIIKGIEEIKLNGIGKDRIDKWVSTQMQLLKVRLNLLLIGQYQRGGAIVINQGKNIIITFFAASAVLDGQISLGAMLAIQYIIGQLNMPIRDIVRYIQTRQDAQLSYERLSDVVDQGTVPKLEHSENSYTDDSELNDDVTINSLSFSFDNKTEVVKKVDISIPYGNHIAIVGESGSGKTTLLKLLSGLLSPSDGSIKIGEKHLNDIPFEAWANNCSMVLQDGHIFSGTLLYNITLTDNIKNIDRKLLNKAVSYSCLGKIIKGFPLGFNTIIGTGGRQMSKGQSQRLFIARAIYKNGNFLLMDEASSALDNVTEFKVIDNIRQHFKGKTIISVAHKLHTIMDADTILLINDGEIIERGSHEDLIKQKGIYYDLFVSTKIGSNPKNI